MSIYQREERKRVAFIPSRELSLDAWKELGMHSILGVEDVVEPECYPIIGTTKNIHDLINHQFRVKTLNVHPDKTDSLIAKTDFERITTAWDELLNLKSVFLRSQSWKKSIGSDVKPTELYPQGMQLFQRHLHEAAKSRMTTDQSSNSSMTSRIPLRRSERHASTMSAQIFKNKSIKSKKKEVFNTTIPILIKRHKNPKKNTNDFEKLSRRKNSLISHGPEQISRNYARRKTDVVHADFHTIPSL